MSNVIEALKIVLLNMCISEEQFFLAKTCSQLDTLYRSPSFWRLKLGSETPKDYVKRLLLELQLIYEDTLVYLTSETKKSKIRLRLQSMLSTTDRVYVVGNPTSKTILTLLDETSPNTNYLVKLTKHVHNQKLKLQKYIQAWTSRNIPTYPWLNTPCSSKDTCKPKKTCCPSKDNFKIKCCTPKNLDWSYDYSNSFGNYNDSAGCCDGKTKKVSSKKSCCKRSPKIKIPLYKGKFSCKSKYDCGCY